MTNYGGARQQQFGQTPAEVFQYFSSQTAMTSGSSHTLFMSDADLANFCRNNKINLAYNYGQYSQQHLNPPSNNNSSTQFMTRSPSGPIMPPVGSKFGSSGGSGGFGVDDISSKVRSHLDSRLKAPSYHQKPSASTTATGQFSSVDSATDSAVATASIADQPPQTAKRRLAPTQITTENILPISYSSSTASHSVWRQQQSQSQSQSQMQQQSVVIGLFVIFSFIN